MSITPLPTVPQRSDGPAVFADRADTFLAALPTFAIETESARAAMVADAASAAVNASAASGAAAAAGAIAWVSGTTYAIGDARYSLLDLQTYRRKTAGAGTTDPSADATNWARLTLPAAVPVVARTSNTIITASDMGKMLNAAGTWTQTFSAASALGSGWSCYIRNTGNGDITLDPNASELIDGLTSFVMYPGECRLLQSDGIELRSIVISAFKLEPTTTMAFIEPPGYRGYEVFIAAPGGGGGSGRRGATGGKRGGGSGGGAGTTNWSSVGAGTPGAAITLTVGADGAGGAAVTTDATNGNSGTAGGTHSFGSILDAAGGLGGGGGTTAASVISGGSGPSPTLGMIVSTGTAGGLVDTIPNGASGANSAPWGATGGGGGGGLDAANAVRSAGKGGDSGITSVATQLAGGIAGVNGGIREGGNGNFSMAFRGGTGGGGAAAHASDAGAAGGNGRYGGGGGGGSASVNGQPSGAGGNGTGYFYVGGIV